MINFILNEIKKGQLVVLEDNEGNSYFVYPAELITSEVIKKMLYFSEHLVGLALPSDWECFDIPLSTSTSSLNRFFQAFSLATENSGISTLDAVLTIRSLINSEEDGRYIPQGLIYPILTKAGTSLVLPDIPEIAFDLISLAEFKKGAVFCSIVNDNGEKLSSDKVDKLIKKLDIQKVNLDDIIEYRLQFENLIELATQVKLPTEYGNFKLNVYKNKFDKNDNVHLALTIGDIKNNDKIPYVRVHSEWSIGNIINRLAVEKGSYLNQAMKQIAQKGHGVILLLYNTPDKAMDLSIFSAEKAQADIWVEGGRIKTLQVYQNSMSLGLGAQILRDLGITKMRLLTNAEKSFDSIFHYGLEIVEKVKF